MKKIYTVTVGTRRRITVPFDCWMDARCKDLVLDYKFELNGRNIPTIKSIWKNCKGMQKNMSYRVVVNYYPIGTQLKLIPDAKNKQICLEVA